MKSIRIGSGSGWWGDMLDPAVELAEKGDVNYIGFDHLAELTLSILQRMRKRDPKMGYIPDIIPWSKALLPITFEKGIKMITNAGGANPESAADEVVKIAKGLGLTDMKAGVVTGDDITDRLNDIRRKGWKFTNIDTGEEDIDRIEGKIVAANVYIGADTIIECLRNGADYVITGRASDNALYVGPVMHEFGWDFSDKYTNLVAAAITNGHIVECASCCTGGMSNMWKVINKPWRIGFPIMEISENGDSIISKVEGSGGLICEWTIKEHLVYEIHDPTSYLMPDGISDFTQIRLEEIDKNKVRVTGSANGRPRPDTLKVCIGFQDGFIGEGMVFFSWPDALEKARKAEEVIRERYKYLGIHPEELRIDYVGYNMMHGPLSHSVEDHDWNEMGLRIIAKTKTKDEAEAVRREVTHLWADLNPITGAAGVPIRTRPVISLWPTLVPRDEVPTQSFIKEVK